MRVGRMSASPFAFHRGSAALMAVDHATTPTSGIRVQACGDAHLMNSGAFAAQHLKLRESDAPPVAADRVRRYRERMADDAAMRALDVWYDKIDLQAYEDRTADPKVTKEMRDRTAQRIEAEMLEKMPDHLYPKLAPEEGARSKIKDDPPLIYHPTAELKRKNAIHLARVCGERKRDFVRQRTSTRPKVGTKR